MALAGALCHTLPAATGVTNKHLRALITGLLGGIQYTPEQSQNVPRQPLRSAPDRPQCR